MKKVNRLESELNSLLQEQENLGESISSMSKDIEVLGEEIKVVITERNSLMQELLVDHPYKQQIGQYFECKATYLSLLPKVGDKYYLDELDIVLDFLDAVLVCFDSDNEFSSKDFKGSKMLNSFALFTESLLLISKQVENAFDTEFSTFFQSKTNFIISIFPVKKSKK